MILLPAAMLFVALCTMIVVLSSPARGMDLARAGPPKPHAVDYYSSEDFTDGSSSGNIMSSDAVTWMPVTSTVEPPVPLLHLALQRIADSASSSSSSKRIHLERLDNLEIKESWQESTGDVERDADPETDRWYRWIVVACFYEVNDSHGKCETLDVRTRTAWRSGTPPTQWPFEVKSSGIEKGPLPTTGDALLLTGVPPEELMESTGLRPAATPNAVPPKF
jgi:hypothetical protein